MLPALPSSSSPPPRFVADDDDDDGYAKQAVITVEINKSRFPRPSIARTPRRGLLTRSCFNVHDRNITLPGGGDTVGAGRLCRLPPPLLLTCSSSSFYSYCVSSASASCSSLVIRALGRAIAARANAALRVCTRTFSSA